MEIERKFRIKKLPEHLEQYPKKHMEQAYLCSGVIVRVRRTDETYTLTYKYRQANAGQTALVNREEELPLTREAYEHLRQKADGNVIRKTRYLIPLSDGLTAELDCFEGKLAGLTFVEVEFPDEASAQAFAAPAWFGEEVTFDKRFHNYYLTEVESVAELFPSEYGTEESVNR